MNLAQTVSYVGDDGADLDIPNLYRAATVWALMVEYSRGPWEAPQTHPEPARATFRNGSVPGNVYAIVKASGTLMSSDEVRAKLPDAGHKQVSVALSDLTSRGLLAAKGPSNDRRYRIPTEEDLQEREMPQL